jgi:hypothetical protein
VEKADGRLPIDVLQRLLFDIYGEPVERAELARECRDNALALDGNHVVLGSALDELAVGSIPRAPGDASAPAPERSPATPASSSCASAPPSTPPPSSAPVSLIDLTGRVPGIPASAREHFEELLRSPLRPAADVLLEARDHLKEIEQAGRQNEFIDISVARRLVERMERLLAHVAPLSPITRRIAQAAVLYFISPEDAEDDFDLGGLDDDDAVLSAVLTHLELS